MDQCRRRVQQISHGHRGHKNNPLCKPRGVLRVGADLLTSEQAARTKALLATGAHVEPETTWGACQRMTAAYQPLDREQGSQLVQQVTGFLARRVPVPLTGLITLGRTLNKRADDVLACLGRLGTSNGPTQAINGRLAHLCGPAPGSQDPTNHTTCSLLKTAGFRPQSHPQPRRVT